MTMLLKLPKLPDERMQGARSGMVSSCLLANQAMNVPIYTLDVLPGRRDGPTARHQGVDIVSDLRCYKPFNPAFHKQVNQAAVQEQALLTLLELDQRRRQASGQGGFKQTGQADTTCQEGEVVDVRVCCRA